MVDVLDGGGLSGLEIALVVLFAVLFAGVSFGFWTVLAGLSVKLRGGDPFDLGRQTVPIPETLPPTAVVMPIFHEDVERVFAGLRAVYRSLAQTGHVHDFHFFVLSDSHDPVVWLREEQAWFDFCREVNGFGQIFYRRRRLAINRKSGGIADFCRRWGRAYRYLIVLDADSLMTGTTLVRLVALMEAHPRAGILQTVPSPVGARSLHARIQQFAQRLYGPLFAAGLNHWQLAEAAYWGHNAILRVAPFMEHCALPRLSGRGPLSGSLLSHDFVEAAWMRRAGYQVWLAPGLEGSFEELPPTLLDSLKRDRRWCQGNLQHGRLLAEPGLHGVQRLNLLLGIVAYAMAPLWLAFLVLSTLSAAQSRGAGFTRSALASLFHRGHARAAHGYGARTLPADGLPAARAEADRVGLRARGRRAATQLRRRGAAHGESAARNALLGLHGADPDGLPFGLPAHDAARCSRHVEGAATRRAGDGLARGARAARAARAAGAGLGRDRRVRRAGAVLVALARLAPADLRSAALGAREPREPRGPRAPGRSVLDARGDVAPARARGARRRETPTTTARRSDRARRGRSVRQRAARARGQAAPGGRRRARRPARAPAPARARARSPRSLARPSCGTCSPMRIPSSRSTAKCGASRAARTCRRSGAPRSPRSAAGAPEPGRWRSSSTSSGSRRPHSDERVRERAARARRPAARGARRARAHAAPRRRGRDAACCARASPTSSRPSRVSSPSGSMRPTSAPPSNACSPTRRRVSRATSWWSPSRCATPGSAHRSASARRASSWSR